MAAIDDIIERGGLRGWLQLRDAAAADPVIRARIRRIVTARSGEQSTLYHDFWRARLDHQDRATACCNTIGHDGEGSA